MYFPAVTDVCLITAQDMHIDTFDRIYREEFLIHCSFQSEQTQHFEPLSIDEKGRTV
jgi:hypothetical protein